MNNSVEIRVDEQGYKVVYINDICYRGKRMIDWRSVKYYLTRYVDEMYTVVSSGDTVYIGKDLPDEYAGSKYTHKLKGTIAKAKANAAQGIAEMIEIADEKSYTENKGKKHLWKARFGWYRYKTRFALPVFGEKGEIERYNVFTALLIVRHDRNGKLYLYDILDIKKETSNPLES